MTQSNYDQIGTTKKRGEEQGSEIEITYVVYLIDGNGDEFFVSQDDKAIRVNAAGDQKPLVVKNLFQISAHLNRLRENYLPNCRLFALEFDEFLERKNHLGSSPPTKLV